MGGKSSKGNDDVVKEQRKQAEEARRKEAEREARLKQGMGSIKNAFEGAPIMGTRNAAYDWSKFKPAGVATAGAAASPAENIPTGYTAVEVANPAYRAAAARPAISHDNYRGMYDKDMAQRGNGNSDLGKSNDGLNFNQFYEAQNAKARAASAAPTKVWALKDAQGNIHYQGEAFNADQQYDTGGRTGGFDDAFYNDYKTGITDYYQPQVDEQLGDAKKELTYRLARAGTLRSSMAADEQGDLAKQYNLNSANVLNQADRASADLRSRVSSERAKTESQLQASEDPNAAASQALSAVRDISLDQPNLSPLGMIFNLATIGTAGGLRGYKNAQTAAAYQNIGRKGSVTQVGNS